MGVYYRKRIPIGKWFRINLSKNGAGLSFGRKGASISTGKRGTFLNWSIPGTGIYSRKKLSGPKGHKKQTSNSSQSIGGLSWCLLFFISAVNLILGLTSSSRAAYITAGVFAVLGIIVLLVQNNKQSPSEPKTDPDPEQIIQKPAGEVRLTKEMVSQLPTNESSYLVSHKPLVDAVIKELRSEARICVPDYATINSQDADTVDAILYLLSKMKVVKLTNSSPKTWEIL